MSSALALPEKKFTSPIGALELRALELEVVDQPTLQAAATLRREIKQWLDAVEAECAPTVKKAHELHKDLVRRRDSLKAPFLELEADLKAKCDRFVADERRKAAEASAKAEAEARAARAEAEAEAKALAEAGQMELAGVVEDLAREIVAEPPPPVARAAGMSVSEIWKAEVVDMRAFLQGVLDGVIPMGAVEPTALLAQQARALKSELRWPGVRVTSSTSTGRR